MTRILWGDESFVEIFGYKIGIGGGILGYAVNHSSGMVVLRTGNG